MNLNINTKSLIFIQILFVFNLAILSTSLKVDSNKRFEDERSLKYKKKTEWLKQHLSRAKRSFLNNNDNGFQAAQNRDYYNYKKAKEMSNIHERPCPVNCNCNYDTINCNDLVDACDECLHWPQIDFNQIINMKPASFKNYRFAPNRTTHIIIYKLLNSTLGENSFDSLHVPENSQIEITFQYNSLIKFDKLTLNGLHMGANSTLVFNFPYTTQVVFLARCFDGVYMRDPNARVILRILKSFSVRFVGDIGYFYLLKQNKLKSLTDMNKTSNLNSLNTNPNSQWSISTGQFIIDIKSTHLVKFEEYSFANLNLKSNSKFYIDLELVEKLMVQRNAFLSLNINDGSKMTFYAKQITFIDLKAYSFSNINLHKQAKMQVYLDELTSSLCVQRNVFSNMRFCEADASFNFSIINSKNVQLMHDSFSNITIDNKNSKLFIGVFNMPSLLLLYQNNNYFQSFLNERLKYLWSQHNPNGITTQYSGHYAPPTFQINNQYFYNHLNINNGLNTIALTNRLTPTEKYHLNKLDLYTFYLKNKQSYSYNVSIEKNCFSNLTFTYDDYPIAVNSMNIWLAVDNIHTLLIDNFIFNYSNSKIANQNSNNINFILNVKHFALSTHSLQYVKNVNIEFLREPKVFKFGLAPQLPRVHHNTRRNIKIIGLNLNTVKPNQAQLEANEMFYKNKTSNQNKLVDEQLDIDYYNDALEQDNLDSGTENKNFKNELKNFNENRRHLITTSALIDDNCNLTSLPNTDTIINIETRNSFNSGPFNEMCSCQTIYLVYNQINSFNSLDQLIKSNLLPCKINDLTFIKTCYKQLEQKCREKREFIKVNQSFKSVMSVENDDENEPKLVHVLNEFDKMNEIFLKDYIKFWDYCITEMDPVLKGNQNSNKEFHLNSNQINPSLNNNNNNYGSDTGFYNFNDIDGLFSASLSSSSFYDQSIDSPINNHKDSSSLSSMSSYPSHSSNLNGVSNNIGKIVGIIIICFVCGIIIFMVAINIIQYKFRNDLLDDLDCSSQNNNTNYTTNFAISNNGNNGNNKNCKNNSFNSSNNELQVKLECANEENEMDLENVISEIKVKKQNDEEQRQKLTSIKEVNCYEFETYSVKSSDEKGNRKEAKYQRNLDEIIKSKCKEDDSCFDDGYEYDQDANEVSSLNKNKKFNYDEEEIKRTNNYNEIVDDYDDEEDEDDEDVRYYRKKVNNFKMSRDKITNDSGKSSDSQSSNLTPPSSNERLDQNQTKNLKSSNLIKSKINNNLNNKKVKC